MKSLHTKQAHLQTAQADTQTKVCKRACFSPTQDKNFIFFLPFGVLIFFQPHNPRLTRQWTKFMTDQTTRTKKAHTANITYTQAGVSCFVGQESGIFKIQFFVGSSVVKIPACV